MKTQQSHAVYFLLAIFCNCCSCSPYPELLSGCGSIYIIRYRFAGSPWHDSDPPVPAWVPPPPVYIFSGWRGAWTVAVPVWK